MKKYSSSYTKTKNNFAISNTEPQYIAEVDVKEYGIFCVVQNILQRGVPTPPSHFLVEQLGEISESDEIPPLISSDIAKWKYTIKGDSTRHYYPAQDFFDNLIFDAFGDSPFLRNLILPEAYIADIIEDSEEFEGQQVDFYFPQIRTVIEIDGSTHSSVSQHSKDRRRDEAFRRNDIEVIRIPTENIREGKKGVAASIQKLKNKINGNVEIEQYIESFFPIFEFDYDTNISYGAVMRIQMMFLECLKSGKLKLTDPEWCIKAESTDIFNVDEIVEAAYYDLKRWIGTISALAKVKMELPELILSNGRKKHSLKVDISMEKRYTDEDRFDKETIFIRTDYYDDKNYYKVAFSDSIEYKFILDGENNDLKHMEVLLWDLFRFKNFRDGQLQIITHILSRNDTIGILPTGSGKSLCYQFAAMLQPGITMVVVPIISLMTDQKRGLDKKGFRRTNYVSSQVTGAEREKITSAFEAGKYQIIWVSPERFQNSKFRHNLAGISEKLNFTMAVIDEVHCLSEWGHDFRVSYLTLVRTIKTMCYGCCLLGLTATASQAVITDIKNEFGNDGSGVKTIPSLERKELVFKRLVVDGHKKQECLTEIFKNLSKVYGQEITDNKGEDSKCGLIFSNTAKGRNGCERIFEQLNANPNFHNKVITYHGKLNGKRREEVQNLFMDNKYPIMTCTKAFGMGIDKSNIKYTIHYGMPQSIESFYQEAGRAGRAEDKSEKSYCYIIYTPENVDDKILMEIFDAETKPEHRKELCNGNLKYDLNSIMFLWNLNKKGVDEEFLGIRKVLAQLYKGEDELQEISFSNEQEREDIQTALYKLSILGIVETWTIDYNTLSNGIITVTYNGCDADAVEKNLTNYIKKYDKEFSFNSKLDRYAKYKNILAAGDKRVAQLLKVLIVWVNENIMYQRLKSTDNMMRLCSPDVSDDDFRNRLIGFFAQNEDSFRFDEIVFKPLDYEKWINLLYVFDKEGDNKEYIDKKRANSLFALLQRYLESYRYNPGLNFLTGMLGLFLSNNAHGDEKARINECMKNVKEMDKSVQDKIVCEMLNFGKLMNDKGKDDLSAVLYENYPEKNREIYKKLNDRHSLAIEIENAAANIDKFIEENVKWII